VAPSYFGGVVREQGLAGWGDMMASFRKNVIKKPAAAVRKYIGKPIAKILPKPLRKLVSLPGKAFDSVKESATKVLSKLDDSVREGVGITKKPDAPKAEPPPTEQAVVEVPTEIPIEPPAEDEPDNTVVVAVTAGVVIVAVAALGFYLYKRRKNRG
jgi:hypothetical protein